MPHAPTDRIENHIEIARPIERVWRALTDHAEFGQWFRVVLAGPFQPGQVTTGRVTYPGFEHLAFEVTVLHMKPPTYFAFTWHPSPIDPAADYSAEPPTLVEFHLSPAPAGTHLRVTESGFGAIPDPRRREQAFRMNTAGWAEQLQNIREHLINAPPNG